MATAAVAQQTRDHAAADAVSFVEVGQDGEDSTAAVPEVVVGEPDAEVYVPDEDEVKGPGMWFEDDFDEDLLSDMMPAMLTNLSFTLEYVNTTANINATLKPIPVCQFDCHGRGLCMPIPSPSPSPSIQPKGASAVVARPEDAAAAARNLTEQLKAEALNEAAPSPPPDAVVELPEGASPSVTPLPGQEGGPLTPEMVPGAPAGFPGGPALPYQRRTIPGMCVCNYSFYGPFCEFEYCYPGLQCSGRGMCRNSSSPYNPLDDPPVFCECQDGWKGDNCEFQENRCGVIKEKAVVRERLGSGWTATPSRFGEGEDCNHGMCFDGVCVCHEGWDGAFCDQKVCPLGCSGHGECDRKTGGCMCDLPFFGKACALAYCPGNCSGHGMCDRYTGDCDCDLMWNGDDCEHKMCPHNCHDQGDCNGTDGTCTCYHRYKGYDCSQYECPNNCGGGHTCINGSCICDPGWKGRTCNTTLCHGKCLDKVHGGCEHLTATCYCDEGWIGNHCDIDNRCPKWRDPWDGRYYDCHNNGHCEDGKCVCDEGFRGEECTKQYYTCDEGYQCANGGKCSSGRCECVPPWRGFDCSITTPHMCSTNDDCIHGDCINGLCHCAPLWSGDWCTKYNVPDSQPYVDTRTRVTPSPSPISDDANVMVMDVLKNITSGAATMAGNNSNGTNGSNITANGTGVDGGANATKGGRARARHHRKSSLTQDGEKSHTGPITDKGHPLMLGMVMQSSAVATGSSCTLVFCAAVALFLHAH